MAKFIVQHRRGTTEQLESKTDFVPHDGEIVIEYGLDGYTRLKVGDGITSYANLLYLNMPSAAVVTKRVNIELPADNWVENDNLFYQTVGIANITENSKIDLQPTPEQLNWMVDVEVCFTTKNDGGIVTVYALGYKPTVDLTADSELGSMQATVSETVTE